MPDEALLSDLCTICYTQKPKYRCPGCKTQTCSLPCYKRHQQRASCSGKRDPAVFVKRSQLATPAGIDQDYNYLKGVERSIDLAARETSDRGVGVKPTAKGSDRGLHPESLLQRYLVTNRINVERAPKGMSRQKTNQTRFTKRQNVLWTVEWVDEEGSQVLQADNLASNSVHESHELMLQQKRNSSMRRMATEISAASTTKRKRTELQGDHAHKSSKVQQDPENAVTMDDIKQPDKLKGGDSVQLHPPTKSEGGVEVCKGVGTEMQAPDASEPVSMPDAKEAGNAQTVKRSYYLLKPGTISASKVLIPLDSGATLTKSLQDQTVLEYPTIYVLPDRPESLPSKYLLEKDYEKIRKGEDDELNEAIKQTGSAVTAPGMREQDTNTAVNTQIDPQKILDMLKRDVTR